MSIIYWIVYGLYLIGFVASGYLIYRYARYSDWRQTAIGRSFMLMKVCLFTLFTYLLIQHWLPFPAKVALVFTIVGGVDVALIRLTSVIVKLQGGWHRDHVADEEGVLPREPADLR